MAYHPGTATMTHPLPGGKEAVPSWRGAGTTYTVDVEAGTCDCPDFVHRKAGRRIGVLMVTCKHLVQVKAERKERAQRFNALLYIAREEPTANLLRCLKKYEETGQQLDVCVAIRVVLHEREVATCEDCFGSSDLAVLSCGRVICSDCRSQLETLIGEVTL